MAKSLFDTVEKKQEPKSLFDIVGDEKKIAEVQSDKPNYWSKAWQDVKEEVGKYVPKDLSKEEIAKTGKKWIGLPEKATDVVDMLSNPNLGIVGAPLKLSGAVAEPLFKAVTEPYQGALIGIGENIQKGKLNVGKIISNIGKGFYQEYSGEEIMKANPLIRRAWKDKMASPEFNKKINDVTKTALNAIRELPLPVRYATKGIEIPLTIMDAIQNKYTAAEMAAVGHELAADPTVVLPLLKTAGTMMKSAGKAKELKGLISQAAEIQKSIDSVYEKVGFKKAAVDMATLKKPYSYNSATESSMWDDVISSLGSTEKERELITNVNLWKEAKSGSVEAKGQIMQRKLNKKYDDVIENKLEELDVLQKTKRNIDRQIDVLSDLSAASKDPVQAGLKTKLQSAYVSTFKMMDKLVPGLGKLSEEAYRDGLKLAGSYFTAKTPGGKLFFQELRDLNKKDRKLFAKALEGKYVPSEGKLKQVVDTATTIRNDIWNKAKASGLKTIDYVDGKKVTKDLGFVENYYPHTPNKEFWNNFKNTNTRAKIVEDVKKTNPGISDLEAKMFVEGQILSKAIPRYGNLEMSRKWRMPEQYIDDDGAKVFADYINSSSERIAQAARLGADDEIAHKMISGVGDQLPENVNAAQKLYDGVYRGTRDNLEDSMMKFISKQIRGFQVRKLTAAALRQPSQIASLFTQTALSGPTQPLKAIFKSFTSKGKEIGMKISATDAEELAKILDVDTTIAGEYLKWTGFRYMDNKLREIASIAGAGHTQSIFNKFLKTGKNVYKRELERLGVNLEEATKNGKISEDDMLNGAWRINQATNFLANPGYLPAWSTTPWGKVLTQFKTYSYHQGKELYNYAVKEALRGNVKPFMYFGTTSGAIGLPVYMAYQIFTGKELPKNTKEALSGAYSFGSPGIGLAGDIVQAQKYGAKGWLQLALGPTAADIVDVGDFVGSVYNSVFPSKKKGKTRGQAKKENIESMKRKGGKLLTKNIVRPLPGAGPWLANKLNQEYFTEKKKKKGLTWK